MMSDRRGKSLALKFARRAVLAGVAAVVAVAAHAEQPASGSAAKEQQAITLVNGWVAALVAKDTDKVVSLMDEDVQYRDDPFQTELKKGRAQFAKDLNMLLRGLTAMKVDSVSAVAGTKDDVLVLAKRTDEFNLGGKSISVQIGAYYRVRNGKIYEWLDTPLVELPKPPGGAPGGAPPGGKL
jgi:limonene-1,2-epoxide hydrolase